MNCPIDHCTAPVPGPMRVCTNHYKLIPRPQQEALSFYAKKNKRGPAHRAAFDRAVESIVKLLQMRRPARAVSTPYRDD